jgi:hypothetical protein
MECSGCGFDIQSGFAFCPRCGAKQPITCAACGYACQPDFAFCPRCGASIPGTAQPVSKPKIEAVLSKSEGDADRRPVTVLFADLCGFTTLSEQIDPEVMRVLQNELFEEMTQAVEAYGGFVDKFVGDALLALFGAPVAHEDDPVRALGFNPLLILFLPYMGFFWLSQAIAAVTAKTWSRPASPRWGWAALALIVSFWVLRNLPGEAFEVLRP